MHSISGFVTYPAPPYVIGACFESAITKVYDDHQKLRLARARRFTRIASVEMSH